MIKNILATLVEITNVKNSGFSITHIEIVAYGSIFAPHLDPFSLNFYLDFNVQ